MRERNAQPHHEPVLVGVDGSVSAAGAIELGAWEARRRRAELVLVHAYLPDLPLPTYGWSPYRSLVATVRADAEQMLSAAEHRAHATHPGVRVRAALVAGAPASSLVELSATASLIVVGARGSRGFPGLRLGSVSAQVARHSHAPVIVVPTAVARVPAGGPVVVGVDGSAASLSALAFGFEAAEARAAPLVAVYAWWSLPRHNLGPTSRLRYDATTARLEAERMLAEALAGWSEKFPDVPTERRVIHDLNPAAALIAAGRGADLLVVGDRGHGGFAGLLLGSVSHTVINHAPGPVAVVRSAG